MMRSTLLLATVVSVGCSSVVPGPGEEAVLIRKPMIFGHGGVDRTPVKTGRTYVALTTSHEIVNMQPIQKGVHFDDLMSSDGVPLDFDAVIRLQVTDSVTLVERFGKGWYEFNVDAEFRNRVRAAVKKHGMNETAIQDRATAEIDAEVSAAMSEYLKTSALPIRLIDVTVGRANPPDAIKNQRVSTAEQEQRINTERQRKLAEDQRREAEQARANADNAYRQAMQLSPDQFLQLEQIKMLNEVCGPRGKAGCTFLNGGNAMPVLNVR